MSLLYMSFSGAFFIIAVVVVRAVLINRIPKKTFLVLWEIAFLRLLIPFSIPFMFSIHTLISQVLSNFTFFRTDANIAVSAWIQEQNVTTQKMQTISLEMLSSRSVWFVIWCIGMIVLAVFFAFSYLRCQIEFQTSLPICNDFVEQWLKEHSIKRSISVRQSDKILAPLTYGILRPVILMPQKTDWKNTKQLLYVLSHEYVHICHLDILRKIIATVVLCIHWFNPMVWVMYILFNRDVELICDECVVRKFGEKSKAVYSLILINMEEKQSGLLPFCNNFSKNAIEERITAIMKIKKSSVLSLALALALVVCVTTAFATSAATKNNNSISVPSIIHRDDATNKTSKSSLGAKDGYQSLLALKSADYLNQTVADFDKALLDWGNQHSEEHEDIIQNDIATYSFPAHLTTEEKNFLALTIRASNIENAILVKNSYGSPVIDPDLSFELARESQETDPPTWVSLMYGVSYHLDPQVVTVGERDTALANAINDIQSFWYDTNLETLAEMSSDEVFSKLNAIADNNSTNAIQLSIVKNYYIFQASSMFD